MTKRYREASAPAPLKGRGSGVPAGKASHVVRVMHRECVTRSTKERRKLGKVAFAVVEYRGTRPVRVIGASDDVITAGQIARHAASNFVRQGDPASVRELRTCKPLTKKARAATRQELHVADIATVRECRTCGSRNKSLLCKPKKASRAEQREARAELVTARTAGKSDDTRVIPGLVTHWTKAQEEQWGL